MTELCRKALIIIAVILIALVLLGWPSKAFADPGQAMADLLQREPSLDELRRAALRHAGLAGQPERDWARRARLAGLLPVVTLRADRETGSDRDLSRSSTGAEKLTIGTDRDMSLEVKAVWKLDRLVFDSVEIRAMQTGRRLYHERVQLLTQITNLYFQRRKLQLAAMSSPPEEPAEAELQRLANEELTAQLDALTGGYISQVLARDCSRPGAPGRDESAAGWACR